MAPPNRPADLLKSTNDTAWFSFGCKIFVASSCFQLTSVGENPTYFRSVRNGQKTGGLRTGKGSFPVGSDSSEKCGKTDGFWPEKQAKKAFLPFKTQLFHIQIVRYDASSFIKLGFSQHRMMGTDLCLYFFGLPFPQFLHF